MDRNKALRALPLEQFRRFTSASSRCVRIPRCRKVGIDMSLPVIAIEKPISLFVHFGIPNSVSNGSTRVYI